MIVPLQIKTFLGFLFVCLFLSRHPLSTEGYCIVLMRGVCICLRKKLEAETG